MPEEKPSKTFAERFASRYEIDGLTFVWTTESGKQVRLPLRVSMKQFMKFEHRVLDRGAFFDLLAEIAADQLAVINEMDGAHDFDPMAYTWNEVYGSPGESGASSI